MFTRNEEISLTGRGDPGPTYLRYVPVADPGFPQAVGPTLHGQVPFLYFAKLPESSHKIEKKMSEVPPSPTPGQPVRNDSHVGKVVRTPPPQSSGAMLITFLPFSFRFL